MRGIETGKVRIRHEVFTEIARLAYEGGDYAKRLEELPFKIIPGEIGTYRDSLFLERAVVGERLRLAMGLPLRKFSEFSLLCNRVLVFREGRVAGSLEGASITEQNILDLSFHEAAHEAA